MLLITGALSRKGLRIELLYDESGIEEIDVKEDSSGKEESSIPVEWAMQFEDYLCGKEVLWELPLVLSKLTRFQRLVFDAVDHLAPFGRLTTYGTVAAYLHTSPRAVGQALHHNPFPIVYPCHRVLPAGGSAENPGGFSSGTAVKRKLIEIEKRK